MKDKKGKIIEFPKNFEMNETVNEDDLIEGNELLQLINALRSKDVDDLYKDYEYLLKEFEDNPELTELIERAFMLGTVIGEKEMFKTLYENPNLLE